MDWVKAIYYGLLTSQFLFMVWLLSSIKVNGMVTVHEPNGIILISELILAGAMSVAAIYLMGRQLCKIASK